MADPWPAVGKKYKRALECRVSEVREAAGYFWSTIKIANTNQRITENVPTVPSTEELPYQRKY